VALAVVAALAGGAAAPMAGAAVGGVAPGPNAVVAPLAPFTIVMTEGEYSPDILLYRSLADAAADDAGGVGPLRAVTVPTLRGTQDPATGLALTPYEPMSAGVWFWRVGASTAPRTPGPSARYSVPIRIVVPRVVRMSGARVTRRGASVTGRYVWRTNAAFLIHRTEVFHKGKRVRRTQSRIAHSPGRRMAGERFTATAALTDNRPPFGRIKAGTWVVRFTISDGTKSASVSRRYTFR